MDVFEGSDDAWRKLKVGDVLRVEAEEDNYNNGFLIAQLCARHACTGSLASFRPAFLSLTCILSRARECMRARCLSHVRSRSLALFAWSFLLDLFSYIHTQTLIHTHAHQR